MSVPIVEDAQPPAEPSWPGRVYGALLAVSVLAFAGTALLLALAVPYHEWDAFAFGELSRAVQHGSYDVRDFGAAVVHRPLFYVLQGWLWMTFGFSFAAGRVLGLAFSVLLVVATAWLAGERRACVLGVSSALAGLVTLAIPAFDVHALSGLSDVPAAALVALTGAVALSPGRGRRRAAVLAVVALATVLAKPSVLAPLAGVLIAVALQALRAARSGAGTRPGRSTLAPLAGGIAAGLLVHVALSLRLGVGFADYLTAGTSDYWAERAGDERWGALARLDVLGPTLRLPLAFVLLYVPVRVARMGHRLAAALALAGAVAWTTLGPLAAAAGDRPLWTGEATFTWLGFLVLLGLGARVVEQDAPARARIETLALLGLPPLLVWWWATPYADRLAATAWPGLCALIAIVLAVPIRALARDAGVAALAPAIVLGVAVWGGIASLDGLGADQWREVRSLGRDGIWDEERTLNIVLPAVQASIAAVAPVLGDEGRLSTSDPRFSWWFPGRVSLGYVTRCDQLVGSRAFVLLTGDESRALLEARGGTADPAWWAACERPRLRPLTDGGNGFAAFAVEG